MTGEVSLAKISVLWKWLNHPNMKPSLTFKFHQTDFDDSRWVCLPWRKVKMVAPLKKKTNSLSAFSAVAMDLEKRHTPLRDSVGKKGESATLSKAALAVTVFPAAISVQPCDPVQRLLPPRSPALVSM